MTVGKQQKTSSEQQYSNTAVQPYGSGGGDTDDISRGKPHQDNSDPDDSDPDNVHPNHI